MNKIFPNMLEVTSKLTKTSSKVDMYKLVGEFMFEAGKDFFTTEYFTNLLFLLRKMYRDTYSSFALKENPSAVFQSYRDYSKLVDGGNDCKVVIFGSEIIDAEYSNGRAFGITKESCKNKLPSIHKEFNEFKHWLCRSAGVSPYAASLHNYFDFTGDFLLEQGVLLIPAAPMSSKVVAKAFLEHTEPLTGFLLNVISETEYKDVIYVLTDPDQERLLKFIEDGSNDILQSNVYIIKSYELDDPNGLFNYIDRFRKENLLVDDKDRIVWG